MKSPRCR